MDSEQPQEQAIAIWANTILAVGSDSEVLELHDMLAR